LGSALEPISGTGDRCSRRVWGPRQNGGEGVEYGLKKKASEEEGGVLMIRLPPYTHRFFWDIDTAHLNVDDYRVYVLARLLEYADPPSVRWMLQQFSPEEIIAVLQSSRQLSPLSANFWALYFDVDKETVPCLSKPSPKEPGGIWPY